MAGVICFYVNCLANARVCVKDPESPIIPEKSKICSIQHCLKFSLTSYFLHYPFLSPRLFLPFHPPPLSLFPTIPRAGRREPSQILEEQLDSMGFTPQIQRSLGAGEI